MIKIDSREKHYVKICEHLGEFLDDDVFFNVEKLENGADYIIENEMEMGIQRKEISDFVGSIDSLKDALHDLRSNYELSALLIEGNWKTAGGSMALRRGRRVVQTRVTLQQMHNMVLSQQLRGTYFIRTVSLEETARLLADWHGYLDGSISPSTNSQNPVELFAQLPGVGPKRAEAIEEKFGNAYYAWNQFPDGWLKVDGIGQATIDNVEAWLRGEEV